MTQQRTNPTPEDVDIIDSDEIDETRFFGNSVVPDSLIPPLKRAEDVMIRLTPLRRFAYRQFRRLWRANLTAQIIFDNERRNCNCVGGVIRNQEWIHEF